MRTVVSPSPMGHCTEGPPVVSCLYFKLVRVPLMPLFPGSVWGAARGELDTYYTVSHSLLRHCAHASVLLRPVAHRGSTCRQYESSWKKFQGYIRQRSITAITPETFAGFATFLFHSGAQVSPSTVSTAMAALRDPMHYGFDVVLDRRTWDLLRASFFRQRPPSAPTQPSWSLEKVLSLLQSPRFTLDPSPSDCFLKTLFLVALATGHRVSQLAALLRAERFLVFGRYNSSVTEA